MANLFAAETVGAGDNRVRLQYLGIAIAIVVVASIIAANLNSKITYTAVEGIAVFAILYVLALAVERFVEYVKLALDFVLAAFNPEKTAKARKLTALAIVKTVTASTDQVANASKDAKTASTESLLISGAIAFSVSIILVAYCKYSLLAAIGFNDSNEWIGFTVTALAIMGGSAGVHDLLGRIQKPATA
jgi:hypothetical protein